MLLLMFAGGTTANSAPVVEAGATLVAITNVAVTLEGIVTDDGLPSATLTSLWTVDSGPGIVTFVDATDPTTDATFDTAGSYVLRLTGDDTALTAFDTVTVLVSDPPAGGTDWLKLWQYLWH